MPDKIYFDWKYIMRNSWVAPVLALAAGTGGAVLRKVELATAFEEGSGLPVADAPATVGLAVLSVAIVTAAAVFAALAVKKDKTPGTYHKAFYNHSFLSFMFSAFFGAVVSAASAVFFLRPSGIGISGVPFIIFSIFAVLAGLSIIMLAMNGFTQKKSPGTVLFAVIPPVFFCFWLAVMYRDYAACPTIIEYCYRCLAIAFCALAFYYAAGYAFGRAKPKMTVTMHLVAIFFICVTLADNWPLVQQLLLAATLGFLFQNSVRFLRSVDHGPPKHLASK